jgi:Bacterioferritin (cytochrome b1)
MHEKSIALLNKGVADELSAVHQYMYFHFHCADQGYSLLAQMFFDIAIQEMLHVERLAERILFLGGEVEMTASAPVSKIHDPAEMLTKAREMEIQAIRDYNTWAQEAAANADLGTKQIFEALINEEETHYDRFDTEVQHLAKFGANYLALQAIEGRKTPPAAGGQGA